MSKRGQKKSDDVSETLEQLSKVKSKEKSRLSEMDEIKDEEEDELTQDRLSDLKKANKKRKKKEEKKVEKPQVPSVFLKSNQTQTNKNPVQDDYLASMLSELGDEDSEEEKEKKFSKKVLKESIDDLESIDLDDFDEPLMIAPVKPIIKPVIKKVEKKEVIPEDLILPDLEEFIPETTQTKIESCFEMYFLDAYEERGQEGTIYLFGKIQNQSCCVVVKNLARNIYVLPHPDAIEEEMDDEIVKLTKKNGIRNYKHKVVDRNYAFEKEGIPHGTQKYIKLVYSFSFPTIKDFAEPNDVFSTLFGSNSTGLELFLIKRKIKGPCWIKIKSSSKPQVNVSWCKNEFYVSDPKEIQVCEQQGPAPNLSLMSLRFRTIPNGDQHEIVMISAICHSQVPIESNPNTDKNVSHFTLVRKVDQFGSLPVFDYSKHSIQEFASESHMLTSFFEKMSSFDPDVLIGHNFMGWDLDILLHRCFEKKIKNWSQIGRLNRSKWPKLVSGSYSEQLTVSGRLICDTYIAARDYLRESNYSLKHLAKSQLGKNDLKPIENEVDVIQPYFSNAQHVIMLAKNNEYFGYCQMLLTFHMTLLTMTKELANAAGSLWSRALIGNRAERIEYLLLHEFHTKKFITPDKEWGGSNGGKKKKAEYAGGLVIQPLRGLYDKYILLLDFVSLYPSIILEKNLCFTTVERKKTEDQDVMTCTIKTDVESVLPKVIKMLLERRGNVKNLMNREKDAAKKWQLDIKQKALKLIANSTYGCLGFPNSRFYCKTIAEMITAYGRDNLTRTKSEIEKLGYPIIYGDTDSVMVLTPYTDIKQAQQTGNDIINTINKQHKNLSLSLDGLFRKILLLEKKKYVALTHTLVDDQIVSKIEKKGVDMVRRDWCDLSKDVSKYCIDQILSDFATETVVNNIHDHLRQVAQNARSGQVEFEKFVLTKELSKAPSDYPDAKQLPHVMVAKRMLERGQNVQTRQRILYVICVGSKSLAERAYSVEEFQEANGSLVLDFEWYLTAQIHPPVLRLCHHIEGTDSAQLALALGLDTSRFHQTKEDSLDWITNDDEKYKNVVLNPLLCKGCKQTLSLNCVNKILTMAQQKLEDSVDVSLLTCPTCATRCDLDTLTNWICNNVFLVQQKYYQGVYVSNGVHTTTISLTPNQVFCSGHSVVASREFGPSDLYLHLTYLKSLVDFDTFTRKAKEDIKSEKNVVEKIILEIPSDEKDDFDKCVKLVETSLQRCGYRYVNLGHIFGLFKTE